MGWIARTVLRSLKRAEAELQDENRKLNGNEEIDGSRPSKLRETSDHLDNPLRIDIVKATGGKIVRFAKYDRQHDRNNETTYVISQDEDFTETMTKLINLELMK